MHNFSCLRSYKSISTRHTHTQFNHIYNTNVVAGGFLLRPHSTKIKTTAEAGLYIYPALALNKKLCTK